MSAISEPTLKDSLLDGDFQREIRETDSVRVPSADNLLYKSYDASEKTLIIEDSNFDNVVELKLLTDYNAHVGVGKDVKVAELLLVDYSSVGDLFEALNFYNVNNDYNSVEKSFKLKYASDSIVENCQDVEQFDNNVSVGFKNVCYSYPKTNWVEFNSLSELSSKNVRIGIFTDTTLGEKIEWVPTIEGFEVLEWASYLADGLVFYSSFDDDASNSTVTDGGIATIQP